ncbi:MAG: PucR family transcriptional regulator [Sciscionella sp.]
MTLTLREILAHPALTPADPVVRAGAEHVDRLVRWVHSSEVLEIAPLLRGGELLLTGGVVLGSTNADDRRRYVRELASRGVAAVAIETGPQLPEIPAELRHEASGIGFPVIELRRVVPFVAVTEAINGLMVNEVVRRLREADALSHLLSAELARGGGAQELLEVLGRNLGCDVALKDAAGRVLASATTSHAEVSDLDGTAGTASVLITVHGMSVARLIVVPGVRTDPTALEAALDRAPELLSLALARTGVVTPEDGAIRELLRLLRTGSLQLERLARLARAAGLSDSACVVGIAVQADDDPIGIGAVDATLRRHGRHVLASPIDEMLCALVVLRDADGPAGRDRLIADLRADRRHGRVRVGVGPFVHGVHRFGHTMTEASRCLAVADEYAWSQWVIDAVDLGVELLLQRVGSTAVLQNFIEDHLGPVLALGPRKAATLVETLDVYFRHGCSKTATARQMNVQRQTLYQRLDRVFAALGGDPTGTRRAACAHLAARLYTGGFLDVKSERQ